MSTNRWRIFAAALLMTGLSAGGADLNLGLVNMTRAFSEFYKTKLADAQLREMAQEFNEERRALIATLEELRTAADTAREQAQVAVLTEEARRQKRAEAEERLVEQRQHEEKIRQYDDSRRKQLEEQSRRMRSRLVDEIRETARSYAQQQGLSLVWDSSAQGANGLEILLYSSGQHDITGAIIEALNKSQKVAPATADEGASETKESPSEP